MSRPTFLHFDGLVLNVAHIGSVEYNPDDEGGDTCLVTITTGDAFILPISVEELGAFVQQAADIHVYMEPSP